MKNIICFLIVFVLISSNKSEAQTGDTIIDSLLAINQATYLGKPLDSIIGVLPSGYIQMKVVGISQTARKLRVLYPNEVWIELHVREFTHMNAVDTRRTWNVSLMREEKLFQFKIQKDNTCYLNCDLK